MNDMISLSETLHPEEYQVADIAVYPADEHHALVYARDTEVMDFLHSAYVQLLTQCSEFKTLDEHLATFCQEKQFDERLIQGLRAKLHHLAQEGYLIARKQPGNDSQQSGEPISSCQKSELNKKQNSPGIICELPNGLSMVHSSTDSIRLTRCIYEEIFQKEIYLKHGLVLTKGDCVFDVGANVGLFALYIHSKCEDTMIYGFEPIPSTFDLLRANICLHSIQAKIFNYGLSDRAQSTTFTHYPSAPMLSGRFAGERSCQNLIKGVVEQIIQNWIKEDPSRKDNPSLIQQATMYWEDYFRSETYECSLKTLSQVIREENIERIDLLKVDAEGSEVDVFMGIEEQDWPKIKQIVLEAHSDALRDRSMALLQQHGLKTSVELCHIQEGTDTCYMIYGTRER